MAVAAAMGAAVLSVPVPAMGDEVSASTERLPDKSKVWVPGEAERGPATPGPVPATPWDPPTTDTVEEEEPVAGFSDELVADSDDESGDGLMALSASSGTTAGAPGLGLQSWYGTEDFPLSAGLSAHVNVANGNLVLSAQDVAIRGPGKSLALTRFHNNLSATIGSFGAGWSLSETRDVGLDVNGSSATFYGPSGFTAEFTEDSNGDWTPPAGLNADLVEDSNTPGLFTLTYRKSGEFFRFDRGWITRHADRNNVGLSFTYGGSGVNADKVTGITDGAGRFTSIAYDSSERITSITDPASRVWTYTYTGGRLTTSTTPGTTAVARVTNYGYDTTGNLIWVQAPGGAYTEFGYDSAQRVTSVTRYLAKNTQSGNAAVTEFTYTAASGGNPQTTVQTNPLGEDSTYRLDTDGRVDRVTDPLGRERSAEYSPNHDVTTAIDAMGSSSAGAGETTYDYDTVTNNLETATSPTGAASHAFYGSETRGSMSCSTTQTGHPHLPKCAVDAEGNKTNLSYDTAGNLLSTLDTTSGATGGVATSSTYQGTNGASCAGKAGQVCSTTDGKGATTNYEYDTDGNLVEIDPPAPLPVTTMEYDALGRMTETTTGTRVVEYGYSVHDQLGYELRHSTDWTEYGYDVDGLMTQQADYDTTDGGAYEYNNYVYDALGRQTEKRDYFGALISSVTHDKAGNVTSHTDNAGTLAYGYDAANQLIALAEPGGTCATNPTNDVACTRFQYNANGALTQTTYPGGTTQAVTVDKSGRATNILAENAAGTDLSNLSYSYASTGQDRGMVRTRTDHLGVGAPAGSVTTYSYDSLNRLSIADEKTANGTLNFYWGYNYDDAGNRIATGTIDGSTNTYTSTSATFNDADQITSFNGSSTGWSHDAYGNMTGNPAVSAIGLTARTNSYTGRDQLTSTTGASQGYDYFGATNYERNDFRNALVGMTGAGGASYIRTPGGAPIARHTSAGSEYYLTDNLGSVVGLVNTGGTKTAAYSYDPYGVARHTSGTSAAANPLRYTGGHYETATGLYKLGHRYYDPALGRFTQIDPSGSDPHYTYAGNNPVNRTDRSGLAWTVEVEGCGPVFTIGQVCVAVSWDIGTDDIEFSLSGGIGFGAKVSGSIGYSAGGVAKPIGGASYKGCIPVANGIGIGISIVIPANEESGGRVALGVCAGANAFAGQTVSHRFDLPW